MIKVIMGAVKKGVKISLFYDIFTTQGTLGKYLKEKYEKNITNHSANLLISHALLLSYFKK